jgi:DNA-binding response OmpR family regulator
MVQSKKQSPKKIVFIVEDDQFLVKAYQIKFKKEGIESWLATDGKEALNFFEKEPPSVVLLDLMLPGLNGFEVLENIRKNEKWKNTPVLILTNLGQEQDMAKGKNLGAADYIIKANTKIDEVVQKVKKYL